MNTPRILLFLLLTAAITRAQAQDNPAPAPAAEPAQTEMQKWLATTDAQWQAVFKRDITDVHDTELSKVKLQYLTMLETGIAKASAASDLDGALALRHEQKRFGETNAFPEQDLGAEAASVKQLRAAIRVQLARVEKENAVRVKALHAKYDQVLAQAQAQLTQRQRLDDALLVKNKRDEVAAAWITPAVAAAVAVQPKPPVTPLVKPTAAPQKTVGEEPSHRAVKAAIVGGTWVWQSTDPSDQSTIQFADDGTGSHGGRGNTKWEVTGSRKITIVHNRKGTAVIHLSPDSKSFEGTGYNGKPVSGKRLN